MKNLFCGIIVGVYVAFVSGIQVVGTVALGNQKDQIERQRQTEIRCENKAYREFQDLKSKEIALLPKKNQFRKMDGVDHLEYRPFPAYSANRTKVRISKNQFLTQQQNVL